jgi:hypothetical protein
VSGIVLLHFLKNASFLKDSIIVRTTFSAKNNNNPNREGRNYKRQERVRGGAFWVFGFWSGRSDRCGTVKGAETASA